METSEVVGVRRGFDHSCNRHDSKNRRRKWEDAVSRDEDANDPVADLVVDEAADLDAVLAVDRAAGLAADSSEVPVVDEDADSVEVLVLDQDVDSVEVLVSVPVVDLGAVLVLVPVDGRHRDFLLLRRDRDHDRHVGKSLLVFAHRPG